VMRAGEVREDLGLEPIDYEAEDEIAREQQQEDQAAQNQHELDLQKAKGKQEPGDEETDDGLDPAAADDAERKQKQEERASSPNPKAVTCQFCKAGMKAVKSETSPLPHHRTANGDYLICDDNVFVDKSRTTASKKKDFASKRARRLRASTRPSLALQDY
jgi:hypothetical protein